MLTAHHLQLTAWLAPFIDIDAPERHILQDA
jgi:hypothetical protein